MGLCSKENTLGSNGKNAAKRDDPAPLHFSRLELPVEERIGTWWIRSSKGQEDN